MSSRHYSVDSCDSPSQGNNERDAKRLKSQETQRAFRARKANHVKDLEVKVALQDIELARLKRENEALRLEVENLRKGSSKTTGSTAAASKTTSTGCCKTASNKEDTVVESQSGRYISHLDPQNAVNYESPRPSVQHPYFSSANPSTLQVSPQNSNAMQQPQSSYATSTLPVMSPVATRPVQPTYAPSTSPLPPLPPSFSDASNSSHSPSISLSTTDTPRSTSTYPEITEPIIVQSTAQLTKVVCCNGMFNCEDETEMQTRWVKENTGVKGIGSNTIDDFYSLFGDHSMVSASSNTG